MLSLSAIILNVFYAKSRNWVYYAECRYAQCRYAECRGANVLVTKISVDVHSMGSYLSHQCKAR